MNTQTLLLTDLTPQEEENVSGGIGIVAGIVIGFIFTKMLEAGWDRNSAYQQAVQKAGVFIQKNGLSSFTPSKLQSFGAFLRWW